MKCNKIELPDKLLCTGCSACAAICPVNAIKEIFDEWGFSYPCIDNELCMKCGACTQVCPVLQKNSSANIYSCYAAQHKDKSVLSRSTSGGVFFAIAEKVLARNGIVYGCEMSLPDCKVTHTRAISLLDLQRLQGFPS